MHADKNKDLKQLFHISQNSNANGQQVLSIRLGEKHGCFAITNKPGNELYELGYCSVLRWDEKELTELLTAYPSLQHSFYDCQVVYDFPQGVFVPATVHGLEETPVLLNGGNNSGANIITEQVQGWQFNTMYAVPAEIQQWLGQKFPAAKYRHQYSLGIRMINTTGEGGSLLVDLREDDFTVMVAKAGKFLLAQSFAYSTPDDVLYYLIKICRQFSLSQQDVELSLSGLVDKQSSLYRELYQYFIHIAFRDADWSLTLGGNTGKEYPAHFFTSLNDLAKCAS